VVDFSGFYVGGVFWHDRRNSSMQAGSSVVEHV
jgi:hypothetical protein